MQHRGFSSRLPFVALIVVLTFCSLMVAPAWSQTTKADTEQGTPAGVGMQVAAVGASLLYFPVKGAFAIGGGIIGSLAYVFSGLNEQTAKSIWVPSMYGTYLITPDHLNGDRPVRFLGAPAETDGASSASEQMGSPTP